MNNAPLACLILAAGHGSRMRSGLLKPLHEIAGRAMVRHVLAAAEALQPVRIVTVIGPGMAAMVAAVQPHETSVQDRALGTGDAVRAGLRALGAFAGDVMVLYGDTPLVTPAALEKLLARRRAVDDPAVIIATTTRADPFGYGRVIQDTVGRPQRIVEEKDADAAQRKITLCNSGIMLFSGHVLPGLLDRLTTNNAKGEYYLTDIVALARSDGHATAAVDIPATDVMGVNTRVELAEAEAAMQRRLREKHMLNGATLQDPATVYFSWDTELGRDVTVQPNVFFGPEVRISNGVTIRAFSHLEQTTVGDGCGIGPFARLRGRSEVAGDVHIGNFVELKNSRMGEGAKAGHLTYLGDADIGKNVNIGGGTITCNYDGFVKSRTMVGAGAFIGANAALVAPVTIGGDALVAAGSVIVDDVPDDALALGRGAQINKPERGMATRRHEKNDGN